MTQRIILATDANKLPAKLLKNGFVAENHAKLLQDIINSGLWLGPRDILEEREDFRQIIPYIVMRHKGRLVNYIRASSSGESRLHGRLSLGLGGHVDFSDIVRSGEDIELSETLENATTREVDEELGEVNVASKKWIGVIADDETPVGRVHIGIVGLWDLKALPNGQIEHALEHVQLSSINELTDRLECLEDWSKFLLPYLSKL